MKNEYNTIPPKKYNGSVAGNDVTMPGKRERKPDGRFAVGDLIMNRYKVLAELGQGGMGVVYRCLDETAGIEVALKALPPELSHNTIEMEDIKDNFQLVHNLHHPNIASSNNLERDNSNGNYYLIMECCEGEDLRRWIKRKRKEGELKLKDVLPIVKQVADALDYAHEQKIIHRDIKPGNIIITPKGKVKVLDFGLAAQIHTSMTRVSMAYHGTSGTGPYMAPEQWRGRAQGAPADQYALAVMTYEMLAGRLPFESSDASVLREAVLKDTPEELENISKPAQAAIKRAMSKEPSERFASCSDFVAALGGKKVKSAKPAGKSFPKWAAGLIIAALLGAGGAGYYFLSKKTSSEVRAAGETKSLAEEKQDAEIEDITDHSRFTQETGILFSSDNKTITGVKKEKRKELLDVKIPLGVTTIGKKAFSGCSNLKTILLPDSIINIGSWAFEGCFNLRNLVLPNNILTIEGSAFSYCINLRSIKLPDNIITIAPWTFGNCKNLKTITIPDHVTSIGSNAFMYCFNLNSINLGKGIEKIGESAFNNCRSLSSIIIPDNVTTIGRWAFSKCENLTEVTIGNKVTTIGDHAFWECRNLRNIEIPDNVKNIERDAFYFCKNLRRITIPSHFTDSQVRLWGLPRHCKVIRR